MSVLNVKLRRDLRRQPAQLACVVLLVLVGVGLFGASYDAYRNLSDSYNEIFTTYKFADLLLVGGNTKKIASTAQATSGVGDTQVRTVADVPFRVPGGDKFVGRAVGMPTMSQPTVDQVDVEKGTYLTPAVPNGVLVETHMAGDFGLGVGDTVDVWSGTAWQHTKILGVVSSPEYLWPAESRQNVLPAPKSFGVLFVPQALATTTAKGNGVQTPNQVALYYPDAGRADAATLDAHLGAMAQANGAGDVVTRAEQPSNATLNEDIQGFSELAVLFPLLFLTAAGMATYVVLTRRVARDRAVIGMLRASGFGRRPLAVHYLWTGLIVGIGGAIPGVIVGVLAAGALTRVYTHAIGIPVTVVHINATTVLVGLAFGVVAGALSALAPALSAARVPPAEAMRGFEPAGGRRPFAWVERIVPALRRMPAGAWLVVRGPARNWRRTLYTEIGIVLALILILVSWGMLDSTNATLNRQFDQVQLENAQVTLATPVTPAVLAQMSGISGVAAAEPSNQLPVTIGTGQDAYATALVGFIPATTMHGFLPPGGGHQALPDSGLLLGVDLQHRLHLSTGGPVAAQVPGHKRADVEVAGFVDEPLGTFAYASLDQVAQLTPGIPPSTVMLRFTPSADRNQIQDAVQALPGVVAYQDSQALRQQVTSFMNLFYVFVGIMLVFGGLLAFAILFATMSVNLSERTAEVGNLRVSGVSRGRLAGLITEENVLLAVVGVVPGLILGYFATAGFMASFNSDLFRFQTTISWSTYVISAAAVVAVALVAQWPGLRTLARLDLGRIVRERAG